MANTIEPGTEDCEPGTLAGAIKDAFLALIAAEEQALVEVAAKRIAFAVASGWVDNVVASIDDGKALVVDGGQIVGGDAGGVVPDASTSVKGIVELATDGESAALLAVQANDSRLTNARTPTAHASTHYSGGSDAIKLDDLAAPDDNTDLNASTSTHGLAPKLSGTAGTYLDGLGAWTTPALTPRTIYELDWATQPSQVIAGDGVVVIDGINWTAVNVAASTTFALVNGTGLQMTAATGVNRFWSGATTTSPALTVPLTALSALAGRYLAPITLWFYFPTWSTPQTNNAIMAGCYSAASGSYTAAVSGTGFTNDSGVASRPLLQRTATYTPAAPLGAGFDVVAWRCEPSGTVSAFAGSWAAGWPTAMTPIGFDSQPYASSFTVTSIVRRDASVLIVSPATRNTVGAPSFTLARTRVVLG